MAINTNMVVSSADQSPEEKELLSGLGTAGAPKKKNDLLERIRLAKKGIVKVDPTDGGTDKYETDEEAAKSFLQTEEVQQQQLPEARRALSDRLASSLLIKDPTQRQEAVSGLQKEGEALGILKDQFQKVAGDYSSAMEKQIGTPQREERTRSFLEEMRNKSLGQRRRKTYSRFGDLKLARKYRRAGFDKAAQAVAMRGALKQQEMPAPSIATPQFLKAKEDVVREKAEMQTLQKRLMERLLGQIDN
tara:strand:- start:1529 stop:2269 length:741 start_codon:yes stop_codon:yes gene_type:complete